MFYSHDVWMSLCIVLSFLEKSSTTSSVSKRAAKEPSTIFKEKYICICSYVKKYEKLALSKQHLGSVGGVWPNIRQQKTRPEWLILLLDFCKMFEIIIKPMERAMSIAHLWEGPSSWLGRLSPPPPALWWLCCGSETSHGWCPALSSSISILLSLSLSVKSCLECQGVSILFPVPFRG